VTQHVVARREILGDLHNPGVIVAYQHVRGPAARIPAAKEANAINLEEFKRSLIHSLTVAIAVGQVVDDGAWVWPRKRHPLEEHRGSGRDRRVPSSIGGIPMANDIG
jgi:hypothetical protein